MPFVFIKNPALITLATLILGYSNLEYSHVTSFTSQPTNLPSWSTTFTSSFPISSSASLSSLSVSKLSPSWNIEMQKHSSRRSFPLFMEYEDENEISPSDIEPLEDPILQETETYQTSEDSNRNNKSDLKYSIVPDLWEELHGNYILRPENFVSDSSSPSNPPRALIHFLGGAFIGAAPDISYRYLLERLAQHGYLIVATPYNLSFDYLTTCDTILDKFERIAPMLARQYGAVPVVGVGHSCGALLHLLITTLFPDTPRAANALMSYNNKNVKDAVPLFDTLVSPAFQTIASNQTGVNGVESIKLWNDMVKTTLNGKITYNIVLFYDMIRF